MNFRERSQSCASSVCSILQAAPSPQQEKKVADAIEQAIIEAVRENAERCAKVAQACCSADRDLAHKIAEEIRRQNTALIANLEGMR
jgi:hypothetical protein